ncbi:MAG: hypothetical protein LQ345_003792 [Seirophora villosa]|nr:MAG: hypothetical protein LQ345_003792 [Seirophora villosa]
MASGVEAAGLVLGALPLVIAALQNYNNGLKPLKDFVNYETLINQLVIDLQTQHTLLQCTCEKLLTTLSVTDAEFVCLLEDPASPAWKEDALVHKLEKCFESHYATFISLLNSLAAALKTLAKRIGYDVYGQPLSDYTKKLERYWKKFKTCLSQEEHKTLIERMQKANNNLQSLVEHNLQLGTPRSYRQTRKSTYRHVRDCADRLHRALCSRWLCDCSAGHYGELQLQQRDSDQPPCFRLTFPIAVSPSPEANTIWHETEVKSCPKPTPTVTSATESAPASVQTSSNMSCQPSSNVSAGSSLQSPSATSRKSSLSKLTEHITFKQKKRVSIAEPGMWSAVGTEAPNRVEVQQLGVDIDNLCSVLRRTQRGSIKVSLGQIMHDQTRYEVVSISQQDNTNKGASTLHDMLVQSGNGPSLLGGSAQPTTTSIPGSSTHLTKMARLRLAVILASTVLQLHTTPWLDSGWSGKEIYFRHGSVDTPYITRAFTQSGASSMESSEVGWGPIRNHTLFALGVLLLEISFRKPFEHLKSYKREQGVQQQLSEIDDYYVACHLIKDLADEEGQGSGYYEATRTCIRGDFGNRVKEPDLANDIYRQAVYEDVILPLEKDLEYFCKGP